MSRVAVNCECTRVGGTRAHLRRFLDAARPDTFVPLYRDGGGGFITAEPAVDGPGVVARPLSLRERVAWERQVLPQALAELDASVFLQPSNIGVMGRVPIPRVHIVHNVAPLMRPLRTVARGRLRARLRVLRALTLSALRSADGVIFLSEVAREMASEWGWSGRGTVIRPGLDAEPTGSEPREPSIIVVAHLFRFKRVEDAVRAFVRSGIDREGFRLDVYGGPYDGRYASRVITEAVALDRSRSVLFHGAVPAERVRAAVARATAVLQPSACENAPQIVYECLASGTPIVASDIPAHREVLQSGLYPLGDLDTLVDALRGAVAGHVRNAPRVPLHSWGAVAEDIAAFCGASVSTPSG